MSSYNTRAAEVRAASKGRKRVSDEGVAAYFVAILASAFAIVPVLYVVYSAFRSSGQLSATPLGLPDPIVLKNYETVLQSPDFWRMLFASTVIAVATTIGVVLLGVMAAYPLARYEFPGKEGVYTFFTAGLLFPITVAALPLYLILLKLHLPGTPWGLVLPQIAFQLPVTIVILRPFVKAIPKELEEAAAIDGAGRVGFFFHILLRLTTPALVTVGVLAFVGSWNAYLLPLLVVSGSDWVTLPLGVARFQSDHSQDTALILAFLSLAMLPAIAFFTALQGRIVSGLSGAVKG
ncbi:MAG: carbohydrate ABC transporter permease [Demequinaceae bacterium]|nr:carbohydrate ABC transporter permease [Demequinaceae bacterium]